LVFIEWPASAEIVGYLTADKQIRYKHATAASGRTKSQLYVDMKRLERENEELRTQVAVMQGVINGLLLNLRQPAAPLPAAAVPTCFATPVGSSPSLYGRSSFAASAATAPMLSRQQLHQLRQVQQMQQHLASAATLPTFSSSGVVAPDNSATPGLTHDAAWFDHSRRIWPSMF
jgi:hypothetical protein